MKVLKMSPELRKEFRNGVYAFADKNALHCVTAIISGIRFYALKEAITSYNREKEIKEFAKEPGIVAYDCFGSVILMREIEGKDIKDILDL